MGNQEGALPSAKNNPVGNQPPAMGNQEVDQPSAKNNPVGNQPPAMGNQEGAQPSAKNNPVGNQPPAMGNQEGAAKNNPVGNQPPAMGNQEGALPSAKNNPVGNQPPAMGNQEVDQPLPISHLRKNSHPVGNQPPAMGNQEGAQPSAKNNPVGNQPPAMGNQEGALPSAKNNPVGNQPPAMGNQEVDQPSAKNNPVGNQPPAMGNQEGALPSAKNNPVGNQPPAMGNQEGALPSAKNNPVGNQPPAMGNQEVDQPSAKNNPVGNQPPAMGNQEGVLPPVMGQPNGSNPASNKSFENEQSLSGSQSVPQDQSQNINLSDFVFLDDNGQLHLTTEFVNSLRTTLDNTPQENKRKVMLKELQKIYMPLKGCMIVTNNPVGPVQKETRKFGITEFFQMVYLNEGLKEHWVHVCDPEEILENYKNGLCEEIRQGTTETPDIKEIENMAKDTLTNQGIKDLDGNSLAHLPEYVGKLRDHIKQAIDIIASGQNGVQDGSKANPSGLTPPVIDETNGVPPSLKENSEEENKGINPETNERPDNKEPLNGGQRVPQDQSQNINLNNVVFFDDNQFQLTQQFVKSLITELDNTPQVDKNFVMLEKIAEINFALSTCQTASDANPVEPDQQELTDIYFNERSMQMICLHENLTEHWVHIFDPLNILETHKSGLCDQIIKGTNDPIDIEEIATKALSREGIKGLDGKLLANSPAYLEQLKKHIAQGVNRMARTPVQSAPDQNGIQDGSKKNPSGPAQQVINGTEGDNPPLQQNSKEDTPVKGVNNLPKIDDQTAKRNDFKEKIIANVSFTENGVMSTYEGLTTDLKKSIEGLSNTEKFNTLWKINNRVQSKYPTKPKAASGTEEVEPKQRKVKRDYSNSFVRYIFNNDDLKDEWVYLFDAEECFTEYMGTLTDEMRNNFNNDKSHITETHYKNCAKRALRKNQIKDSKGKSFATNEQHYDKLKNYLIMSLTTNNE